MHFLASILNSIYLRVMDSSFARVWGPLIPFFSPTFVVALIRREVLMMSRAPYLGGGR